MDTIFKELDSILRYSGSKETVVNEIFSNVDQMIKDEKLLFAIMDKYPGPLYASSFYVDEQNQAWIGIDKELIDMYPERKELVFSIIIHEYKHAYDYLTVENYVEHRNDEIEDYLYEMDALFVEALFIKYYLAENGYNLGNFERYLLASLDMDDLNSASTLFKKVDKGIIYSTYGMIIAVNEGNTTLYELLTKIDNDLDQIIIDSQKVYESDWEKYVHLVEANTLQYYLPILVKSIDGSKRNPTETQEFAIFAENANQKLDQIYEYLQQDSKQQFLINYHKDILGYM